MCSSTSPAAHFEWPSDGKPHWLRVDVRDGHGKPLLLGNPIYLNHL